MLGDSSLALPPRLLFKGGYYSRGAGGRFMEDRTASLLAESRGKAFGEAMEKAVRCQTPHWSGYRRWNLAHL